MNKFLAAVAALFAFTGIAKADITDGQFSTNQIFDVQYYWSGNTLNASSFIAPYDMNFQHPTVGAGQYFKFFSSTTNPGTYGLGLYNSDGTLAQVVHNTGTLQAIGPDALFYVGSGFFGTVITTSAGYSYGQSGTFTNMDTSVSATDASSYTWASTTPLASGQTASSGGSGGSTPSITWAQANPTIVNIYPTSNNSPAGEAAAQAIDGTGNTKYLNFDRTSAGFTVQLSTGRVVSGIQFTTANDFEPRDPSKYTLYGSNDGQTWTKIVDAQAITLSSSRYTETSVIPITNSTAYVFYFITFDSIKAIDTYGSIGACQAALGLLACDSVQIGEVKYLYDSASTVTSSFTGTGSPTVQNPGAPPPAPTIVSTAPGADIITSTTTYGTASTANVLTDSRVNGGRNATITRTTTPVTTTPYTTTVTTTPTTVTTYSDGSTTTTNGTTTTTTTTGNVVNVGSSSSESRTVSISGTKDAIAHRNMNLFLIDPLSTRDGVWATPTLSRGGGFNTVGAVMGWQKTVDNNSFGFALNYSEGNSKGYAASDTSTNSTAGTVYLLTRHEYLWFKIAAGFSSSNHQTTVSIPEWGMTNISKIRQNNVYGDIGVYSANTFYGFRPLAGVLVNTWSLKGTESGSALLSTLPPDGSKSRVSPYVGGRYEFNDTFALESKVIMNTDYKTVISNRVTASRPVSSNVSLNATIGFDRGIEQKYNNVYGLIGLKVTF